MEGGMDWTYIPRFFASVLTTKIGVVSVAFAVAVFNPGQCLFGVSIARSEFFTGLT